MTKEEMEKTLIGFMKNIKYLKNKGESKKGNKALNPNYAHAFVFLFDLSEPMSEEITKSYLEAFKASEANENQSVLAIQSNLDMAMIELWGNKTDME